MKKILIAFVFLVSFVANCVHADELELAFNISSYHYDRSRDLNERNPGIGIRYNDWNIGYYYNSHYRHSTYALKSYLNDYDKIHFGYFIGGVTGYKRMIVMPAAGLQCIIDFGDFSINMMVTPNVPGLDNGFIAFQIFVKHE